VRALLHLEKPSKNSGGIFDLEHLIDQFVVLEDAVVGRRFFEPLAGSQSPSDVHSLSKNLFFDTLEKLRTKLEVDVYGISKVHPISTFYSLLYRCRGRELITRADFKRNMEILYDFRMPL